MSAWREAAQERRPGAAVQQSWITPCWGTLANQTRQDWCRWQLDRGLRLTLTEIDYGGSVGFSGETVRRDGVC